jgi:hypothetical protein
MLSPPVKLTPCAVAIQWCALGLPAGVQYIRGPWVPQGLAQSTILAMLNIEPPEPKNSGSNADDPINLAHLLGMLHTIDLIC